MGVDIIEAGFPIASQRRFRGRGRGRQAGQERGGRRARPRHPRRHRPGRRGGAARAAGPHPHVRFDLADPSRAPDEEDRGPGARDHHRDGDAGAQPHRQCRVERDGRDAHADRFPLPLRRARDPGRRDDDQHARHRRLRGAGGALRAVQDADRAGAGRRQGDLVDALPQRPRAGGRQLAGRRCGPGRGRSSARSTGSASGRATRRSRRS